MSQASPSFDQPVVLLTSVKTYAALCLGAKAPNTQTKAIQAITWKTPG